MLTSTLDLEPRMSSSNDIAPFYAYEDNTVSTMMMDESIVRLNARDVTHFSRSKIWFIFILEQWKNRANFEKPYKWSKIQTNYDKFYLKKPK